MTLSVLDHEGVRWVLIEGLLPLFGAGVLFWVWGGVRFVSAIDKKAFRFSWKEAFDAMGWLYGAAILAIQSAFVSHGSNDALLTGLCVVGAVVSLLLLLSAMTDRGTNPSWQPDTSMKIVAAVLVLGILFVGFKAHSGASDVNRVISRIEVRR